MTPLAWAPPLDDVDFVAALDEAIADLAEHIALEVRYDSGIIERH